MKAFKCATIRYNSAKRSASVINAVSGEIEFHVEPRNTYQEAIGFAVMWAVGAGGYDRVKIEQ